MIKPRMERLTTSAAFAWRALLFLLPAGVAVFAVLTVAAVRANSAALDIDARAALANRTAAAIDAYVAHIVEDVRMLADVPAVRARAGSVQESAQPAQMAALDKAWKARRTAALPAGIDDLIQRILAQPVSRYLKGLCNRKEGIFREILLTDREGRLVAASDTTEDYEQQDEQWWKEAIGRTRSCATAQECAYAGDVEFDSSAGANAFEVAVPVFDDAAQVTGVLKVVVDPRELPTLLALATASHPVGVSLIRRNGTDVFGSGGPFPDASAGNSPEGPDAVREELAKLVADQQIAIAFKGELVPVRALAGPQSDKWAVAVRDHAGRALDSWIQFGVLIATIVVMFLLSARAYALLFDRRAVA